LIRLFLTPKVAGPNSTGRREKSDHASLEAAKTAFADHPNRWQLDALIYIDGTPTWYGTVDENGRVRWQPYRI
jgi:hypothetical protein